MNFFYYQSEVPIQTFVETTWLLESYKKGKNCFSNATKILKNNVSYIKKTYSETITLRKFLMAMEFWIEKRYCLTLDRNKRRWYLICPPKILDAVSWENSTMTGIDCTKTQVLRASSLKASASYFTRFSSNC